MADLKEQLLRFANNMVADLIRQDLRISVASKRPVMLFSGNPGTGKTSVAKVVAELLKDCGLVSTPALTIATRGDLVASQIGETAEKTNRVIDLARNGTMLIDEVYQLVPIDSPRDTGIEALEAIMATIEGDTSTVSDRPAYILAGYPDEMQRVIDHNPGLRRRITHSFHFPDYTVRELGLIFEKMCEKQRMRLEENVTIADVANVFSKVPQQALSRHNASLASKLLTLCRESVNVRAINKLKSKHNHDRDQLRKLFSTIKSFDLADAKLTL